MTTLAFWMLGPLELLVLAVLGLGFLGVVAAVIVAVVLSARKRASASPPQQPPSPNGPDAT